jgi:cell division protein FtsB
MDSLIQLESLIARIAERARGDADAADLKAVRQLLAVLKKEVETGRNERQKVAAGNLQLKARITVLEQEVALLKKGRVAAPTQHDEFIEHLGAVFVRKPGGRILDLPHCRQCKQPMKQIAPDMPYSCPACEVFALFRPSELNDVLLTLRR